VDCGCHIGKYCLFASNNGMNVIGIDGNTDNFCNYNKNTKLVNVIIDKYKGRKTFYINDFHPAISSVEPIKNARKVNLPCDTVDNICKGIKDIKLIKIDVENNELNALIGATQILKTQHPDILFESWDTDKYYEIRKFLESLGYKSFKLVDECTYFAK
jgi:FkbM family methyltransferase